MTTTELEARLAKLQAVDPMEVGGRADAVKASVGICERGG